MPLSDSCTRVAPGCMDTLSSSHLCCWALIVLEVNYYRDGSGDCGPSHLVSAPGGSLSGEPCVLTWTHVLSQRSWMVALSWCSWRHGWEWVQAVVYGSRRLPERSLDYCVVMVEIWIKISSLCSPRKPLDLALVCLSCKCVQCNTEHARPASQEASHTA